MYASSIHGESMSEQTRWTSIRVPVELRDLIRDVSEKEGKAYWRVLVEAMSFYVTLKRKPYKKGELDVLEKASWYIAKALMSIGIFKENPTEENYRRLERTLNQIKERLGVNVDYILRVARTYLMVQDREGRIELNMSAKILVFDIIYNKILKTVP